jgi:glycine/serine hydroxymethyltransferase
VLDQYIKRIEKMSNHIVNADPEIATILEQEEKRQETGLELIASENSVSPGKRADQ